MQRQNGGVTVNANQFIQLVGVDRALFIPSAISTTTLTAIDAGDIRVFTRQLMADQGGTIASGTLLIELLSG
jgi:hypothetical protein